MTTPTGPQDPYGRPEEPNPYGWSSGAGGDPRYPGSAQPPVDSPISPYGQMSPYAQGGYQVPNGYPAGGTARNNLGVWALVLGILGVCCGPAGIGAIILGRLAQQAVARGEANNGGLATAGLVLGWVSVSLWVLSVILRSAGVIDFGIDSYLNGS